jgi:hypothetical protein
MWPSAGCYSYCSLFRALEWPWERAKTTTTTPLVFARWHSFTCHSQRRRHSTNRRRFEWVSPWRWSPPPPPPVAVVRVAVVVRDGDSCGAVGVSGVPGLRGRPSGQRRARKRHLARAGAQHGPADGRRARPTHERRPHTQCLFTTQRAG